MTRKRAEPIFSVQYNIFLAHYLAPLAKSFTV